MDTTGKSCSPTPKWDEVKPSNILLTRDGRAILADFGIARAVERTRLTLSGGYWGTPAYMSPEQALGKDAGPATDIYALGAIVYQMAVGRVPLGRHAHCPFAPAGLRAARAAAPDEP